MDISAISKKNSPKNRMIYHEDPQALHIGTLPKHCYFIPFAPGEDSFSARENSSRFKLLNGEWDFSYYDSIVDMEDDFTVLPGSEKCRCRPIGSSMGMTSRSIRTSPIRYPTTRLMSRTISRSEFTAGIIATLPMECAEY